MRPIIALVVLLVCCSFPVGAVTEPDSPAVIWKASRAYLQSLKRIVERDMPASSLNRDRMEVRRLIDLYVGRIDSLVGIAETAESGIATTPAKYQAFLFETVVKSASRIQMTLAELSELSRYLPSMQNAEAREILARCESELSAKITQFSVKDEKAANQALQTTSVTRSEFGKVPVSVRQRRGV